MVIVVCLWHTASRIRHIPQTALTPFVSCGVIEISCRWHEAQKEAIVNVSR